MDKIVYETIKRFCFITIIGKIQSIFNSKNSARRLVLYSPNFSCKYPLILFRRKVVGGRPFQQENSKELMHESNHECKNCVRFKMNNFGHV